MTNEVDTNTGTSYLLRDEGDKILAQIMEAGAAMVREIRDAGNEVTTGIHDLRLSGGSLVPNTGPAPSDPEDMKPEDEQMADLMERLETHGISIFDLLRFVARTGFGVQFN